jgi:predicted HicB family RNase H-like nuclease
MTITVKDFMKCVSYRITEGDTYEWACFGPNARIMDYWNGKHYAEGRTISMVYDTQTQVVYQMEAWEGDTTMYRWIHPDYLSAIKAESESRNVDFKEAVDGNKFIDLDVEEDILEKATAIANEEEYDKRVMISLTFDDDDMFLMMKMAHEKDMSLNKFVEYILQEEINRLSK